LRTLDDMEFVEGIVVSTFDLIFIAVELAIETVGYVAWIFYILVFFSSLPLLTICQVSAITSQLAQLAKLDIVQNIDPKVVVPYLPIIELLRAARMSDPSIPILQTWASWEKASK
jgi:hypothetical protein